MIDAGTHHYDAHLPTPSLLSDDDVRVLTMPCYVAIAGTDSLAGGDKAKRRAGASYSPTPRWMCGRHIFAPHAGMQVALNGWGRNSPNSGKRHRDE